MSGGLFCSWLKFGYILIYISLFSNMCCICRWREVKNPDKRLRTSPKYKEKKEKQRYIFNKGMNQNELQRLKSTLYNIIIIIIIIIQPPIQLEAALRPFTILFIILLYYKDTICHTSCCSSYLYFAECAFAVNFHSLTSSRFRNSIVNIYYFQYN